MLIKLTRVRISPNDVLEKKEIFLNPSIISYLSSRSMWHGEKVELKATEVRFIDKDLIFVLETKEDIAAMLKKQGN